MALGSLIKARTLADAATTEAVRAARQNGTMWDVIAQAAGSSLARAAHDRWHPVLVPLLNMTEGGRPRCRTGPAAAHTAPAVGLPLPVWRPRAQPRPGSRGQHHESRRTRRERGHRCPFPLRRLGNDSLCHVVAVRAVAFDLSNHRRGDRGVAAVRRCDALLVVPHADLRPPAPREPHLAPYRPNRRRGCWLITVTRWS